MKVVIYSSKIREIKYEEDLERLYLTYSNGKVYLYQNINKKEYDKLISNIDSNLEDFNKEHERIQAI